jgi:acyl CoA:acetate/3-ketoacid CoA transferase beta subunit
LVRIPAHVVLAVCEVPHGAHPYGFNNPGVDGAHSYVEDEEFIGANLAASRTADTFRSWIDEWVLGVADHDGYLEKLGSQRRERLTTVATVAVEAERLERWARRADVASSLETQVVVTARRLARAARARDLRAVLAGVGLSNLAAWLGVKQLRAEGIDIELMAEIGLFGYDPRPGEPFIFAGHNVPTSKLITDVMGVLGTFVSGPGTRSVGLLGAGQIDRSGAINSTYAEDGSFVVGSGGANDVASAADEVIVTVANQVSRMVESVRYRTCPGDRVRTIVSDLAVFERSDDSEFEIVALLPGVGSDEETGVELVRSRTGWDVRVATSLEREAPVTEEELSILRTFDPQRFFLRDR